MFKSTLLLLLLASAAEAALPGSPVEVLPAGTRFEAACDPSGACWPSFTLGHACTVYHVGRSEDISGRQHEHGFQLSTTAVVVEALDWQARSAGWTPQLLNAHECGHTAGVTRHKGE